MKHNVGDIAFDSSIDDSSFVVCNEERIFQYYSVGTSYIGGRKAIRKKIFTELKNTNLEFDKKTGYITFRFIVNCKGQAGRYRYKEVDSDFFKTTFKTSEVEKLKKAITVLDNWNSGILKDDVNVDSYYHINFKIIDGEIIDIF
ncbi:hypothetical protein V2647_10250 [Tenacibaculum maritimum]